MPQESVLYAYMQLPGYTKATKEQTRELEKQAETVKPKIKRAIQNREDGASVARKIRVR